jgi:hypothetical protein
MFVHAFLTALVGAALLPSCSRGRNDNIVSCRNHATFFSWALVDYIRTHGFLPEDTSVTSELIVQDSERARPAATGCTLGPAMGKSGGWQLARLSRETWRVILDQLPSKEIPIAWCGHPHSRGLAVPSRVVVTIEKDLVRKLLAGDVATNGNMKDSDVWFAYGMDEASLTKQLTRMNEILRSIGRAEVRIDLPE